MKAELQIIDKESKRRSFLKALSWRVIGAVDTAVISWLVSGDLKLGLNMGALDILKIGFYILHDQIWEKISIEKHQNLREGNKKRLHLIKSITWRVFSSGLTFLMGLWILKSGKQALIIAVVEIFTKFYLYYLHERLWHKTTFGMKQKRII